MKLRTPIKHFCEEHMRTVECVGEETFERFPQKFLENPNRKTRKNILAFANNRRESLISILEALLERASHLSPAMAHLLPNDVDLEKIEDGVLQKICDVLGKSGEKLNAQEWELVETTAQILQCMKQAKQLVTKLLEEDPERN